MNEDQVLALLAKLCGDITTANNTDEAKVLKLQQAIAATLINDPSLQISQPFQFEEAGDFSTKHLDAAGLQHLSDIIQRVKKEEQTIDTTIRVFRREVPFTSSQLRGSVPDWGRGAQVTETIGPFFTREGRRVWFDIFRVIPVVQVWMQGAARPFLLVPLEVSNIISRVG
ncbi:MAG: hypothetical protein JWR72_3022, partial [Flavisolibacter sp.]|nr:hypothetical protein [Flavisolibacter sp.]